MGDALREAVFNICMASSTRRRTFQEEGGWDFPGTTEGKVFLGPMIWLGFCCLGTWIREVSCPHNGADFPEDIPELPLVSLRSRQIIKNWSFVSMEPLSLFLALGGSLHTISLTGVLYTRPLPFVYLDRESFWARFASFSLFLLRDPPSQQRVCGLLL